MVGGCHKKVKLSITFLYKSLMFRLFLQKRNFSTSQARKKSFLFFLNQRLVDFGQLWNKKMFHCLLQQYCCLDKQKKKPLTLFLCFLLPSFWKFGRTNNSEKDKTKKRCFFFQRQVFSVLFFEQANFASNKMSRVLPFKSKLCKERSCFSFSFCKLKSQHLLFEQEVFRKVLFVFWTKYIWHKSFRKKRLVFFPLAKTEDFVVSKKLSQLFVFFFHRCTSTKITNDYWVGGCLKNNHFSITNITRWVGLQKKLNC